MHRQILEACLPWFLCLAAAFVCLTFLVRASGARMQWVRLRNLHSCQRGSVQSLSFVLTLPIFIMVVLFIVQMSQLMIGIAVVHYAAFATARAACVWLPAETAQEPANYLQVPMVDETWEIRDIDANMQTSPKCQKIWSAAALACAPIAPSGRLYNSSGIDGATSEVMQRLYESMVPSSANNSRIPQRIQNKLAYSMRRTRVTLTGRDKNGFRGPASYNPRNSENPDVVWNPLDRDWEGPLTVTVEHDYALLPGPGKLLLARLTGAGDRVANRITPQVGDMNERFLTTKLIASATMSNEGLKSVLPYVQTLDN